ncbi:MAG: DUF3368 domain-containing protein [Cyanobacteriota bacterium]|nr:DUF3368 domain-containing protein [Cyanobacteriota bacterium]
MVDEYLARKVASRFGLNIVGVLGIFLNAKRRGLIPTVKPVMDDLIAQASFRISEQLYIDILQFASE